MPNIIVKASLSDLSTLQQIGKQTFFETFADSNSQENMDAYLRDSFSDETITKEISNPDSAFFLAQSEEETIGYLKINFGRSQTEIKAEKTMEIERIYVLSSFHGKKVGQLLFEHAIELAKSNSVDFVWLGVWEENPRAIRFYEKNGFVAFDKHVFKLGEDEQTDIMMKLEMKYD